MAYKLNEKDLESLGVAAAIHQKRLLKMIRSGDPVAFIERYEQAQKMQAGWPWPNADPNSNP